jgi:hypothetical protein
MWPAIRRISGEKLCLRPAGGLGAIASTFGFLLLGAQLVHQNQVFVAGVQGAGRHASAVANIQDKIGEKGNQQHRVEPMFRMIPPGDDDRQHQRRGERVERLRHHARGRDRRRAPSRDQHGQKRLFGQGRRWKEQDPGQATQYPVEEREGDHEAGPTIDFIARQCPPQQLCAKPSAIEEGATQHDEPADQYVVAGEIPEQVNDVAGENRHADRNANRLLAEQPELIRFDLARESARRGERRRFSRSRTGRRRGV